VRRLIQELKFFPLIIAFLFLADYAKISFASNITNFALFSYKIGGSQNQISTNFSSTTLNIPAGATIIAPKNSSVVPQNFTVIGTAPATAQLEIKIDGVTKYSLTSDSNGYYSQEVSVTPAPGSYTITIYANEIEGESVEVEVISGNPVNYPEIESPEDGAKITNRKPQIIGKATANCPITVYAKASPIKIVGIGSSNSSGDFTITLNQDLSSGKTQLFVMDTTNNLSSEVNEVTFIDPEGVVFDSMTNSPIRGAQVTLYNGTTNLPCVPGVEIDASDTNPYLTNADGYYMFNAIDGNYYLRVSVFGHTFPSASSSFPRTITTGSKGEQFTIAVLALTINVPLDPPPGVLSVTPADGLSASGTQGGPFSPSSKTYILTNTGGIPINWMASKGQTWVSLSSTYWVLAGGENTTVTVSINSNANSFTPGHYSDTITFTNITNGDGNTTRPVSLTVTEICAYSISPTSFSHSSGAETGSISVTAPSGCPWTATSNETWITITSESSGTGNGTVNYSVSANTSLSSRTGTIIIAGQTFTVYQAGVSCTYSIFPTTQSFGASEGTESVSVSTQSGCVWTATSNETWITITSGSSGTGNGTVNYSVSANTDSSLRTGTIIIAGQTFTVAQDAPTSCTGPTITVMAVSGCNAGTQAEVPVTISDTAGGSYCSFTITFDNTKLQYVDMNSGTMSAMLLTGSISEINASGKIQCVVTFLEDGPTSGTICKFKFTLLSSIAEGSQVDLPISDISPQDAYCGENGSVECRAACSTWDDAITTYQAYVDGQVSWNDVVACYNEAVECGGECVTWDDVITMYQGYVNGMITWNEVIATYQAYANQ
jgi:hypothetical protein